MSGPSKSYWRKSTAPTPIKKTAIGAGGTPVEYLEWDLYEHNHTPDSYVMNSAGVCTSNPGMDAEYFSQGPERGDGGRQGIFYGGNGDPKIKPREFIFQAGQSSSQYGDMRIVLLDNTTENVMNFKIGTHSNNYPYNGDGLVGAWTIVGDTIIFVNEYVVTRVNDLTTAPVYLLKPSGTYELMQPRPIHVENISSDPNWYSLMAVVHSPAFPTPEYYV